MIDAAMMATVMAVSSGFTTPEQAANAFLDDHLPSSGPDVSVERVLADLANELVVSLDEVPNVESVAVLRAMASAGLPGGIVPAFRLALSQTLTKSAVIGETLCYGCEGVRVAFEGDELRFREGQATHGQLRALGEQLGVQGFLLLSLDLADYDGESRLIITARLVSARDGSVLLVQRLVSDRKRAALGVHPTRVQPASLRQAMYREALGSRGGFGHAVLYGLLRIPVELPVGKRWLNGLALSYRLYDVAGYSKRVLFGVQMGGFMDLSFTNKLPAEAAKQLPTELPISGGLVTGIVGYAPPRRNLRLPRLRLVAQAGGFFGGSLGNTFVGGAGLEIRMLHRLGLSAQAMYLGKSDLSKLFGVRVKLGGWSHMVTGSINWD